MTLHEFPGRVMFSITRPHASRENFGRLPSGVPCRNIFSRRSRKDRYESSWIQVRIPRFVPWCRSYEWMAHVRKRGTWPLLTRTLWVVFHGTPIFKSLGVGFECFGGSEISSMLSCSTRGFEWIFFFCDELELVSSCSKKKEALHTAQLVDISKQMCFHTWRQSEPWPRLGNILLPVQSQKKLVPRTSYTTGVTHTTSGTGVA